MRVVALTLAAAVSLTACVDQLPPREVASTPPSVSYQIGSGDISEANVRAARYCSQFNAAATLQTLQPAGGQRIATYSCAGYPAADYGAAPVPYDGAGSASAAPPVRCADSLHQNLPGGSDYHGPPVYDCPRTY